MARKLSRLLLPVFTLLILAAAAIVPRYFITEPEPEPMTQSERTELFLKFYDGQAGGFTSTELDASQVPEDIARAGGDRLAILRDGLVVDKSDDTLFSTDLIWIRLTDSGGRRMYLLHYFREWTGDWKNWLDVYLDAETLCVYYCYASSGCQKNPELYANTFAQYTDDSGGVNLWAELSGMELLAAEGVGSQGETASAEYRAPDGEKYSYGVSFMNYTSNLFDFKVQIR